MHRQKTPVAVAGVAALLLAGLPFAPIQAAEAAPSTSVVINEVYGGGGNGGSKWKQDFVELYNASDAEVNIQDWTVWYSSAAGTSWGQPVKLSGTIPAKTHFLIQQAPGTGGTDDIPTPDATGSAAMGGSNGNVALTDASVSALTCATTACAGAPGVVDLVGFGTGAAFEGTGSAKGASNTASVTRTNGIDTDDNAADFIAANPPTPTNKAGETGGSTEPPIEPGDFDERTISQVQGTGEASEFAGKNTLTKGIVTAVYADGGLNGFYMQEPGGDAGVLPDASRGIFVYTGAAPAADIVIGASVEVKGQIAEYGGATADLQQTQIATSVTGGGVTVLPESLGEAPAPLNVPWPATGEERERMEGMLYQPAPEVEKFKVSDTYNIATGSAGYGSVALGAKDEVLWQPTEKAIASDAAAIQRVKDDNAARKVLLDDGTSRNFRNVKDQPIPWLDQADPARVNATVEFLQPVVATMAFNEWTLLPTTPVLDGTYDEKISFGNARPAAPDQAKINQKGQSDITVASFNVLNFFTSLGEDEPGCAAYSNPRGEKLTANNCSHARGAYTADAAGRQLGKIAMAIEGLNASVIGLMEIENTAPTGQNSDAATKALVDTLNQMQPGMHEKWAYVNTPTDKTPRDAIRSAIIYQKDVVTPKSDTGVILVNDSAFQNAREPFGQVFTAKSGGDPVFVAVNHFKSKGSTCAGDPDTGQGNCNNARVNQAERLLTWTEEQKTALGVEDVILLGDFNAYTGEDPVQTIMAAGYKDAGEWHEDTGSYSYSSLIGSLDHVFMNDGAYARATGGDLWGINSGESILWEYSRRGYYVDKDGNDYFQANAYRSSDHDPVIVGLKKEAAPVEKTNLSIIDINDFHGRIDNNTMAFSKTITDAEKAVADAGGTSIFASVGDNIGASVFASSLQQDKPTIDVLNALGLRVSAVGNHEFDKGFADLTDRVKEEADFPYLGANVYKKGTEERALPAYEIVEVDGLKVAFIGAVTVETPTLVSPDGISMLDFKDPVDEVNKVVGEIGDQADVFIALYHEGAAHGVTDGGSLENQLEAGGAFTKIVNETSPKVGAIFTGHTHKQYAWDAKVPGSEDKTRPVIQTGNYGENIGQVDLELNKATGEVLSAKGKLIKRGANPTPEEIAANPTLTAVKTIVDDAIAKGNEEGNKPLGEVTADITTAYTGGSYVDGKYVGSNPAAPKEGRDDRTSESTMGNLVGDALKELVPGADIGVTNPGGLRDEFFKGTDGIITLAEANAVLPFLNNLWKTTLTGAQFKEVLEQQWQTDAAGNVPARSYLQLGLSKNVTYTFNPNGTQGDHITAIFIDGKPIDMNKEYVIGSMSFLLQGGDNFRAFTKGKNTVDTGLVDRDAWFGYITDKTPLSPSFARQSVAVSGDIPSSFAAGDEFEVTVGANPQDPATGSRGSLDMTSLGAPQNTEVSVKLGTKDLGTFPVKDGQATFTIKLPADYTADMGYPVVTAKESGTTVRIAPNANPKIGLVGINDFHGRIDGNAMAFSKTVTDEMAKIAKDGAAPLFISAGDNIGASVFASSLQQDKPTIDLLNQLGLAVSTVGNHEFDKGFADLTDRVKEEANFPYLGANVYKKGTEERALPAYEIVEMAGLKVAFIGTVTVETPTLVSPGGISMLDFKDPVDETNKVVKEIGDEADVFIALYHEGAAHGVTDKSTLEEQLAAGGAFAKIVNETSPKVAAIFTGHTHKDYAWAAKVPGSKDETRPVIQTGNYGENIGRVDLEIDRKTGKVISHVEKLIKRGANPTPEEIAANPTLVGAKEIIDAAIAKGDEEGKKELGEVTADITTAYTGGSYVDGKYVGKGPGPKDGRDDRASESTLGNLVGDALKELVPDAEIGLTNPGGLRDELFFAPDGKVTLAEANAVLPFLNNLWRTTLTGAQFKEVLEQQWQTDANGNVPARSYLQLGLSKNVTYTFDMDAKQGEHITGIFIDGKPIDLKKDYVIGSMSFLVQGGDNFRAMASGKDTRDTGLVDRDAWFGYIKDKTPLSPSFARQSVAVDGNLPAKFAADQELTFTVGANPQDPATGSRGSLDMTSLGAPKNTEVTVKVGDKELGTFPVVDGKAEISVKLPSDYTADMGNPVVVAKESGTTVQIASVKSELVRYTGKSRYETAVAANKANPAEKGAPVFLATGENFADALSAGPAAAKVKGSIFLVDKTGKLSKDAIEAINAQEPSTVYLLGGARLVPDALLNDIPGVVSARLSGVDRYATSRAIVREFWPEPAQKAYVATGEGFADSLTGGSLAAAEGAPLILVNGKLNSLDITTANLIDIKNADIGIFGGTGVVSDGIKTALERRFGADKVERISVKGGSRYDTAAAAAAKFPEKPANVWMVQGENYPDALVGIAIAGRNAEPVLMTLPGVQTMSEPIAKVITRFDTGKIRYVMGGDKFVTDNAAWGPTLHD